MEESKFLEAQNLKTQIHYFENCLENLSKKENAVIGISWPEIYTEMNYTGITSEIPVIRTSHNVNAFPTELQEQIKELIQDKLDELKQEFELL